MTGAWVTRISSAIVGDLVGLETGAGNKEVTVGDGTVVVTSGFSVVDASVWTYLGEDLLGWAQKSLLS
jgi:hypothetical protein